MRIGTHLDPERYIYPYGEYAVYHIAQVCNDNGGTKRFCHPALEVLIRYDEDIVQISQKACIRISGSLKI